MSKPNPKTAGDGRIMTRVDFAWIAGATEQTVRRWIASGMPGVMPDGRIEVRAALAWAIDRRAERIAAAAVKAAGGKSVTDLKKAILATDLARKQLAEEDARLDLELRRNELVRPEKLTEPWRAAGKQLQTNMLAVPQRLAKVLAAQRDPARCYGILMAALCDVMREFAGNDFGRPDFKEAEAGAEEPIVEPWPARWSAFARIARHTLTELQRKLRTIEQSRAYVMLRNSDGTPRKGPDGAALVVFLDDGEVTSIRSARATAAQPEPFLVAHALKAWVAHAMLYSGLPVPPGWPLDRAAVVGFADREELRRVSYGRTNFVEDAEIDAIVAAWRVH